MATDLMKQVRDLTDSLEEFTQTTTLTMAKRLYDKIVTRTPVYRGRLRSAWRLTLDAPLFDEVLTGGAPGAPLPRPKAPKFGRGNNRKFRNIFIANGQPYSGIIEEGHSVHQAPTGVVTVVISGGDLGLE